MRMMMRWVLVESESSVLVSKRVEDIEWISIMASDGVVKVLFSIKSIDRGVIEITNECMYGFCTLFIVLPASVLVRELLRSRLEVIRSSQPTDTVVQRL